MKRRKRFAIGFLWGSVALMAGIGGWNVLQSHRHLLRTHERWVDRVSSRIESERLSASRSLKGFPGMSREEIRRELFSRPDFVGAYWFDVRSHEFERWVIPSFERILTAPDPRLVV